MQVKDEELIHTIDFNNFLNGYHSHRTHGHHRDNITNHLFTTKLKHHLKARALSNGHHVEQFRKQTGQNKLRSSRQGHRNYPNQQQNEIPAVIEQFNLDQFMDAVRPIGQQVDRTNEMIRSLNGTWFSQVPQQYQSLKMRNTIGFRRSKTANRVKKDQNSNRYEKATIQIQGNRNDFTKEYQQPNIFPSRKIASVKKIYANSNNSTISKTPSISKIKNQGGFKYQIMKSIVNPQNVRVISHQSNRSQQVFNQKSPIKVVNMKMAKIQIQPVVKGLKMAIYE